MTLIVMVIIDVRELTAEFSKLEQPWANVNGNEPIALTDG